MKGDLERKIDASALRMKGIMAAPRGRMTEPRSVECVRPAMETGEVGTTNAATIIKGETCRVRHEGTTEIINEVTEIEEIEGDKKHETKDEHTGRDSEGQWG